MSTGDSSQIAVVYASLEDLSANILNGQRQVVNLKGDIQGDAGRLQANWTGTGSESWSVVQGKWNTACEGLASTLRTLSMRVAEFKEGIQQADNQVAGLFR